MSSRHSGGSERRCQQQEGQSFFPENPDHSNNGGSPRRICVRDPSDGQSRGRPLAAMRVDRWTHGDARGSRGSSNVRQVWVGRVFPSSPIGAGVPPQRGQHRQASGSQQVPNSQQEPRHPDSGHHPKSNNHVRQQNQQESAVGMAKDGHDDINKQLAKIQRPCPEQTEYKLPSRFPESDRCVTIDYTLEQLERELQVAGTFYGEYIDAHTSQLANGNTVSSDNEILNKIWCRIVSNRFKADEKERDRFCDISRAIERHLRKVRQVVIDIDEPNWDKRGGAQESAMSKQRRVGLKMLMVLIEGIVMTSSTMQREQTSCAAVCQMIKQALAMLDSNNQENFYLYKSKDKSVTMDFGNQAKEDESGVTGASN